MRNKDINILYLDDEENNLLSFKAALRRHFSIHTALSAREAIRIMREQPIHVVVTDQRMPDMTGVQFLEAILPEFPDVIRLILTGFSDVEAIIKAINAGRVYRYVTKPWDENELLVTLNGASELYLLQRRNRELLEELQHKVTEQERIMKLFQKYVPENVVLQALQEAEGSIFEGESRIISVLFSDIRNFTSIAERVDPKVIVAALNEYFSIMTDCVKQYKGTVNKFLGDGMLAIFGAPVSYLDNQDNAVYCALEMVRKLEVFNDRFAEKLGGPISIGIGIDTGEVIAGNIGSEERVEYTVIGDTVNTSSRIESLTKQKPNSILISESTYHNVKDIVVTVPWEPIEVKGKAEKLQVYELIGKK